MRLHYLSLIALVLFLIVPGLAQADGAAVIKDCTLEGTLDRTYSQQHYAEALAGLPADVDEYSDCRRVIERAGRDAAARGPDPGQSEGRGAGGVGVGGGRGGSGGGSAGGGLADPLQDATPAERASYEKAVSTGALAVDLDGRAVSAPRFGEAAIRPVGDLPSTLLVVMALLGAGGLGAAGLGMRRLADRLRGSPRVR